VYEQDIIEHIFFLDKEFHAEYQPIVDIHENKIVAYEALARFTKNGHNVAPDKIFREISDDGLVFQLEKTIKKFQVDRKPLKSSIFLNLDPRCLKDEYQMKEWLELFKNHDEVYLEITEDISLEFVERLKKFIALSKNHHVHIGLDNFASDKALTSFDLLYHVDFIKLDRSWLNYLKMKKNQTVIIEAIVDFAIKEDILVIMEGIESKTDYNIAESLGVDFIQGYYFKDKFITKESKF
jgi:EAL domain-containing protein (putative c-di-GMP-specific phosphodiesterase class I)